MISLENFSNHFQKVIRCFAFLSMICTSIMVSSTALADDDEESNASKIAKCNRVDNAGVQKFIALCDRDLVKKYDEEDIENGKILVDASGMPIQDLESGRYIADEVRCVRNESHVIAAHQNKGEWIVGSLSDALAGLGYSLSLPEPVDLACRNVQDPLPCSGGSFDGGGIFGGFSGGSFNGGGGFSGGGCGGGFGGGFGGISGTP